MATRWRGQLIDPFRAVRGHDDDDESDAAAVEHAPGNGVVVSWKWLLLLLIPIGVVLIVLQRTLWPVAAVVGTHVHASTAEAGVTAPSPTLAAVQPTLACNVTIPDDLPFGICDDPESPCCKRPWRWTNASLDEFTLLELLSLGDECELDRCCMARSSAGGVSTWAPHSCRHANFLRHFELGNNPRDLFNAVDVLSLLPNGSRLTLQGDSVGWQLNELLLCNLVRFGANLSPPKVFPRRQTMWFQGWSGMEAHDVFVGDKVVHIQLVHEYRFDVPDAWSTKELCAISDVLVFNYGLHWTEPDNYAEQLVHLIRVLQTDCANVTLIFRETNTQHFFRSGGFWSSALPTEDWEWARATWNLTDEQLKAANGWNFGCTPLRFRKSFAQEFDWRNRVARRAFSDAGFAIQFPPWGDTRTPPATSQKRMFMIPFGEMTAPLADMHHTECTHFCSSPLIGSPVWDAIYLALLPADSPIVAPPKPPKPREPRGLVSPSFSFANDSVPQMFFLDEFKQGRLHGLYKNDL